MYPSGSLPVNLIAFGRFLHREHGFRIGPGQIHDAARALEVVELADQRAVRNALRPILSMTLDQARVFDKAFAAFFFPGPAGVPQTALHRARREREPEAGERHERFEADRRRPPPDTEAEGPAPAGAPIAPVAATESDRAPALLARGSYSPLSPEAEGEAPELPRVEPEWRDAARSLVRHVQLGLSRRWRPGSRGRRFDLRRTLRASLQTGGEALAPRWLRRPRRAPRFVLLIDGSRSMSAHARTALQLAVALTSVTTRIDVFTFSTALQQVTRQIQRAAAGQAGRLEGSEQAWAGGTDIGACLRDFLRRFADRIVGPNTVAIVVSDGLDVGRPDALQAAMSELHRRSASIVWLNPLLDTPGYEPTATGMRAARPFVSTFTSVDDAAALWRLSRVIRVRA